jgi:hypothetical protein
VKRSPLQRKTPLNRGDSQLKRTPLKQVSKKRAKLNRERASFVKSYLSRQSTCEAGRVIEIDDKRHRCSITAVDVHEMLTRARGGSIVDESNVLALCRSCHDWIHANPKRATELSFLRSQYD